MNDMYIAYSWIAVSVAGLAGFWLHLHYSKRFGGGKDVKRLEERVTDLEGALQEWTGHLQDRLEQLHERVDFAERLLTERAATPEEAESPTPV